MGYVDLNSIHNPATGTVAPATWGDQIRDNGEFLIDPPACSVFNSSPVSLTDNTLTILAADSENYDNNSMHSTVTNNSRITVQTAGRYLIFIKLNFAGSGTGARLAGLVLNGTSVDDIQINNAGTGNVGMIYTSSLVLAAGDYIEARGRQQSGGALNVTLVEFAALFLTR